MRNLLHKIYDFMKMINLLSKTYDFTKTDRFVNKDIKGVKSGKIKTWFCDKDLSS